MLQENNMKIKSYAKINLFLDITGIDVKDGYHYLDSLFQEVTLHDDIELKKSQTDKVVFTGADIPPENTVNKALKLFKEKFGIKESFIITIRKSIPAGAGLGGGSSNAAAVLTALSGLYRIKPGDIIGIGEKIGSDVPFFFKGGLCRVKGKGEIVQKMDLRLKQICFIIIYPGKPVSTKWAYSLINEYGRSRIRENILHPPEADIDFLKKIVYNKFQLFVLNRCQELADIKTQLDDFLDSRLSFMSGSGSSLVYVYSEKEKARRLLTEEEKRFGYNAFFCEPYYR